MRIIAHAVGFLVVSSIVLDTRAHIILLNAGNIGSSCFTSNQGVLGEVFKVTAVEGITVNVKSRSQQHVDTIFLHFLTHGDSHFFNELGVPC